MFGLCLDEQLSGGKTARCEAVDELFGKTYRDKGQGVSPIGGRVEFPANREVCRWIPENKRPLVESPGKPVCKAPFGAETGQHRSLVQLAELTQRADPEPPEHASELGQLESVHWESTEPLRRPSTRNDHAF
jgi:hypothetical protein